MILIAIYCIIIISAGVLGMMKQPVVLPVQVADICAGSWPATTQIIAGIYHAKSTGTGSIIDVSMTDAAYSLLVMPLAKYAVNQQQVGAGTDILSGAYPCYDVYRTSDGYISVGNLEPKFWLTFIEVLQLPELKDSAYAEGDDAVNVRNKLQSVLLQHSNQYWSELFHDIDTCVEPIYPPESRAQLDKQLSTRNLDISITVGNKSISVVKTPLNMSGVVHADTPGPKIGEHSKLIRSQLNSKL